MGNTHPRASPLHFKKKKLREFRRQSVPSEAAQSLGTVTHVNHISFTFGAEEPIKPMSSTTPPRIQINGRDSTEEENLICSMTTTLDNEDEAADVRNQLVAEKRNRTAAVRRMEFLTSSGSLTVRSLDDGQMPDVEFEMKPLNRARSLSPLKQMRTYNYKSMASEENLLDEEQRKVLKKSWKNIKERLQQLEGKTFGYYVFERVFARMPHLKAAFKIDLNIERLEQLPDEHSFLRHTALFTNIIDLAVRNVDQLEAQMAPAMFTYGQRHYNSKMMQGSFNEESVRLFCGQVVCSVVDVLNEEIEPICMEAWIEMMRYLGRTLLNGYDYERLATTKRISINTNDHVFFVL